MSDALPADIAIKLALATRLTDAYVTLTAADATSGVAAVSYRLDGGPWQSGSSFTVPGPADTDNLNLRNRVHIYIKFKHNIPSQLYIYCIRLK